MDRTALAFKQWINSDSPWAQRGKPVDNQPMLDSKRGAMIAHLEDVCGGEKQRRSFLKYLFGIDSSADLTCRQQNALYLWLAPKPVNDSKQWTVSNPKARATAEAVVRAALLEAGQQELPL